MFGMIKDTCPIEDIQDLIDCVAGTMMDAQNADQHRVALKTLKRVQTMLQSALDMPHNAYMMQSPKQVEFEAPMQEELKLNSYAAQVALEVISLDEPEAAKPEGGDAVRVPVMAHTKCQENDVFEIPVLAHSTSLVEVKHQDNDARKAPMLAHSTSLQHWSTNPMRQGGSLSLPKAQSRVQGKSKEDFKSPSLSDSNVNSWPRDLNKSRTAHTLVSTPTSKSPCRKAGSRQVSKVSETGQQASRGAAGIRSTKSAFESRTTIVNASSTCADGLFRSPPTPTRRATSPFQDHRTVLGTAYFQYTHSGPPGNNYIASSTLPGDAQSCRVLPVNRFQHVFPRFVSPMPRIC